MTQASKELRELQLEEADQEPSLEAMLPDLDLSDPKTAAWLGKMAEEALAKQTALRLTKTELNRPETEEDGLRAGALRRLKARLQSEALQGRTPASSPSPKVMPAPTE